MSKEKISVKNFALNSNRGHAESKNEEDIRNPKAHPGGLTTAAAPIVSLGGTWVSTAVNRFETEHFSGGKAEFVPFGEGGFFVRKAIPENPEKPGDIEESLRIVDAGYRKFAKQLWFLLHLTSGEDERSIYEYIHSAYPRPNIPDEHFEDYKRISEAHLNVIRNMARERDGRMIVSSHDFHLMNLPGMIRREFGDRILNTHFMHTPIINVYNLEKLIALDAVNDDTIRELFGELFKAPVIELQTSDFMDNLAGISEMLGFKPENNGDYYVIPNEFGYAHLMTNPIGLDSERNLRAARETPKEELIEENLHGRLSYDSGDETNYYNVLERFKNRSYRKKDGSEGKYPVGLSIERLDPTKAGLRRLYMIERVIDKSIRDDNKFVYTIFWPGALDDNLQHLVERQIRRVNQKAFDAWGHDAIYHSFNPIYFPRSIAAMREASFFTATPYDDGMNLTPAEYGLAQSVLPYDERGFCILSNCGYQRVLGEEGIGYEDGHVEVDISDLRSGTDIFYKSLIRRPKINDRFISIPTKFDVKKKWFKEMVNHLKFASGVNFELVY